MHAICYSSWLIYMRNASKLLVAVFSLFIALSLIYVISLPRWEKPHLPSYETRKISNVKSVNVTVLIDNNPYGNLSSPWGISLYIETENLTILFDAGPSPEALKANSEKLGIDLASLDIVVISHEHADHILGLSYIAELNRNLTVYIPRHMSGSCKAWIRSLGFNISEVEDTTVISCGVAVIGELYGPPYEQALAINVKDLGLIVFVGCSHPGVDEIVAKAKEDLNSKPYAVIGGFHLSGASEEKMENIAKNLIKIGLKKIYPIHCSGGAFRRLLREKYPVVYGDGHVGLRVTFQEIKEEYN